MSKYAIAGRELMKGNIGNAIRAFAIKSNSSELIYPARYRGGNFFFGINGADKAFIWGNYNSSLTAYQQCPIVSAIINRKAQCHVNGKTYVMNEDERESQKPQAKNLRRLMSRPNQLQTSKQFKAQVKVYQQIYGYCPILKFIPVGYEDDFSKWKLWAIPPWMVQVLDNPDYFFSVGDRPFNTVRLTYMGKSIDLPPESVFFLKENQISTGTFMMNSNIENVSMFLPDSKLLPLEKPIDNFIASLSSRGTLIRRRGPLWILSNDSADSGESGLFPIDPDAKKELHADFLQYGIMNDQRRAIITDAKLKLQTVGFDVGQLKLLEGEVQDAKHISDGLNFPPYLLGLVDAKFDNQQIAERNLYTNSIIPDSESDDEQWTEELRLPDMGLKICTDFSHVAALQENLTEKGRGRWYMDQALLIEFQHNLITWNEWRTALGEDTVSGMDLYYNELVAQGKMLPPSGSYAGNSNVSSDSQTQNGNNNSNNNNGNGNSSQQ